MTQANSPNAALTVIAPALLAGVVAAVVPPIPVLWAMGVMALFVLIGGRPMVGLVLMVLTFPFLAYEVTIGAFHVPPVDCIALATALAVGGRYAWTWWRTGVRPAVVPMPGLPAFFALVAIGMLSLLHTDDVWGSAKFLARPIIFFYLMFVALPLQILDTPQRVVRVLHAMFVVGVVVAAMGTWSLALPVEPGALRRAVPIAIAGIAPLGTNHNLLAEVLVSVIPVGVALAAIHEGMARRWILGAVVWCTAIALATFSRNAWLTLAVEGVVGLVAYAYARGVLHRRLVGAGLLIACGALLGVGLLSLTGVAQSSNRNRIQLTEIAWEQFRAHPWAGSGVGTFTDAVRRDRWYIADFGQPLDAHGFVQKLLAETGVLGLLAYCALLATVVRTMVRAYMGTASTSPWRVVLLALLCSVVGSIVFQAFNTSYFVAKLWLPIGIALAAARLAEEETARRVREAHGSRGDA
ncbi:O-antigen ligase family protein [Candidatus Uhrbacteria bacterium]|nr:O-antigen ligase family protein [Candidatus Uhrbacteria bacterium]